MKKALLAVSILFAFGCGVEPLSLWRVSQISGNAVCEGQNTETNGNRSETTGLQRALGIWEIYEGPDAKFYLNGPEVEVIEGSGSGRTLEGTANGDSYSFEVKSTRTRVNPSSGTPTSTIVDSIETRISLTLDGDVMTGTVTENTTHTCTGTACPTDYKENNPNCKAEHTIKGARMEADNFHGVGVSN